MKGMDYIESCFWFRDHLGLENKLEGKVKLFQDSVRSSQISQIVGVEEILNLFLCQLFRFSKSHTSYIHY